MRNRIINLTATGSWQVLGPDQNFPRDTYSVTIKAREFVPVQYRYRGVDEYIIINAGATLQLDGQFAPGDLEVLAALGTIIQIECATDASQRHR